MEALPDLAPQQTDQGSFRATGTDDDRPSGAQRVAQRTERDAAQNPANGCDQETQRASQLREKHARPNVLSLADLGDVMRPAASDDEERRARDSNPQPASRHLISKTVPKAKKHGENTSCGTPWGQMRGQLK